MPPAQPPSSFLSGPGSPTKHGQGGPCQGGNCKTRTTADTAINKLVVSGSEQSSGCLRAIQSKDSVSTGNWAVSGLLWLLSTFTVLPRSWTPALVALGVCKECLALGPVFPPLHLGLSPS